MIHYIMHDYVLSLCFLFRIKTFHRVVSGVAILVTCQFLVSGFLPVAMSILGDDTNEKLENP